MYVHMKDPTHYPTRMLLTRVRKKTRGLALSLWVRFPRKLALRSIATSARSMDVDHLRPTTDRPVKMYCYIFPPKMYWYTLGQTLIALAHRYHQTTNKVD
jgi:hypothetical protein